MPSRAVREVPSSFVGLHDKMQTIRPAHQHERSSGVRSNRNALLLPMDASSLKLWNEIIDDVLKRSR